MLLADCITNQLLCSIQDFFSIKELYWSNESCALFSCAGQIIRPKCLSSIGNLSPYWSPLRTWIQRRRCSKFASQRRYSEIISILFAWCCCMPICYCLSTSIIASWMQDFLCLLHLQQNNLAMPIWMLVSLTTHQRISKEAKPLSPKSLDM